MSENKRDWLKESIEQYGGEVVTEEPRTFKDKLYESKLHIHPWDTLRDDHKDILIAHYYRTDSEEMWDTNGYYSVVIPLDKIDEVITALQKVRNSIK